MDTREWPCLTLLVGCGSRPGKPGGEVQSWDPENRPERLSTFDPFPDRPGLSRPEHHGAATGEPWTLGAQTSVNSSILLLQKINEMGRGNASLSTIDPFLLSNKLLFILQFPLFSYLINIQIVVHISWEFHN